jgi:hypothetical protein
MTLNILELFVQMLNGARRTEILHVVLCESVCTTRHSTQKVQCDVQTMILDPTWCTVVTPDLY